MLMFLYPVGGVVDGNIFVVTFAGFVLGGNDEGFESLCGGDVAAALVRLLLVGSM